MRDLAKRFFVKAFQSSARCASGTSPRGETKAATPLPATPLASQFVPRVINTEKHAAYPKAIAELKATGILPERVELTTG